MTRIAFVPAKYTSRRLPGKNALRIEGLELFLYSARAANKSGLFEEIFISTEDPGIGLVAIEHGYKVLGRPEHLSAQDVGVVDVILETCPPCDELCCIYPSPFIQPEWLVQSHKLLTEAEMVMAVQRYDHHQLLLDLDGLPMPSCYESCGAFYWTTWNAFQKEHTFYGSDCTGYEIPKDQHIDINTPQDFHKAEALYKALKGKRTARLRQTARKPKGNGLFSVKAGTANSEV